MERLSGTVRWFNVTKGFGFVTADGKDFFAHYKQISMVGFKELTEGQAVTFIPKKGEKGWVAEQIIAIDKVD